MPFVNVPGLKGKVYVPEADDQAPKKNPCPDCFSCQMCGDSRCQVCLRQKGMNHRCSCDTSDKPRQTCSSDPDSHSKPC